MTAGDLGPLDPFAEPDGLPDPLSDGERLHRALAEIAVLGTLGEFAAAIGALDEAQAKSALIGQLHGLARDVHEAREQRRTRRRLRRALAAASVAFRREWRRR